MFYKFENSDFTSRVDSAFSSTQGAQKQCIVGQLSAVSVRRILILLKYIYGYFLTHTTSTYKPCQLTKYLIRRHN